MSTTTKEFLIEGALCLIGFFVVFTIVGGYQSHYLFLWLGSASSPSFSETVLWMLYGLFGLVALAFSILLHVHPAEALLMGALAGVAGGGAFAIGYTNPLLVIVAVLVIGVIVFAVVRDPLRCVYYGICAGLLFSLVPFCASALSMARVKDLSYATGSTESVTATEWAAMADTQRESFIAHILQAESSRLTVGSVKAYQAILPKDVLATVDSDGAVLVNYAAIRVVSPSADQVARYKQNNGTAWKYEDLTSPNDIVEGVVHAMAHVYQTERVAGEISEQRTWPYDDANDEKGENPTLEAWAKDLPVDPLSDSESWDSTLESQAWGYASNRLGSYVTASS